MDRATLVKTLRTPVILAIIGGTLVVFLIWVFVVFLPQGSKVSKLNAQAASLQTQQNALNARLQELKHLKNSNLEGLHNRYSALVPSTANTSQFLKQINNIVNASGVTLSTISVSPTASALTPTAPASTGSKTPAAPPSGALAIGVNLSVAGTYDQNLKLIQLIYQAPRLTTINQITLSGGGSGTNRGTRLTATYMMTIYEASSAPSATTTTTAAA
jgi:Tfp pilus assembly protein PilO